MEYSLNTAASLGDIESMVHRFINDSIKSTQPNVSNTVNQHLRDVIERQIGIASNLVDSNCSTSTAIAVNGDTSIVTSTAIVTPSTPMALKVEELGNVSMYEDEVSETKAKGARKIHCSECPRILLSRKNFIKHAEDEHGMILPIIHKSFDDQREFDNWMSYLREERQTEFVSKCGRKRLSNGSLLGYLVCSKGGCGGEINSRKKTAKSMKTCAAYLKVLRSEVSGKIDVEGCIEHTGHDLLAGSSNVPAFNNNNNNILESSGAPSFVVVSRDELSSSEMLSKDNYAGFNSSEDQTTPTSISAHLSSTAGAHGLDAFGALYGSGTNLFESLPSGLSLPRFSTATSSSSLANTPSSNANRTMLSAEILCNFLNAMKHGTIMNDQVLLPQLPVQAKDFKDSQGYQNTSTPNSSVTALPHPALLKSKAEDATMDDMVASSSSEVLHETPSAAQTPDPGSSGLSANTSRTSSYVDVELERRKLALIEQFQMSIQKVDKTTIDGAEVAMRFFVRELEGLFSKSAL